MSWGLYEDLPPPGTTNTIVSSSKLNNEKDNTTNNNTTNKIISEWSVEAKLLAPALQRKSITQKTIASAPPQLKIKNLKTKSSEQTKNTVEQKKTKISNETKKNFQSSNLSKILEKQVPEIIEEKFEEYDPSKPNDYEKVLEERKKKAEKEILKELSKAEENLEIENEDKSSKESTSISVSGAPNSIVAKMMAKMGYKEGHGLGKSEQGIVVPLLAKKTAGKAGIIVGGETKNTLMNSKSELPQSSTVILLLNMAAPGEVDKDLKIEIEDECNKKYGKVIKCIIYEEKEKNVPVEKAVRIFVKFENAEQSKKALEDLNGRYFAGRKVEARYYDEIKFKKKQFSYIDE